MYSGCLSQGRAIFEQVISCSKENPGRLDGEGTESALTGAIYGYLKGRRDKFYFRCFRSWADEKRGGDRNISYWQRPRGGKFGPPFSQCFDVSLAQTPGLAWPGLDWTGLRTNFISFNGNVHKQGRNDAHLLQAPNGYAHINKQLILEVKGPLCPNFCGRARGLHSQICGYLGTRRHF